MYLTTAAFWCRGEAPQRAESDFTGVGTSRLAPPPVRQVDPEFLPAGRFHDPVKWGESVGTRPDAGVGGLEEPAQDGKCLGFETLARLEPEPADLTGFCLRKSLPN